VKARIYRRLSLVAICIVIAAISVSVANAAYEWFNIPGAQGTNQVGGTWSTSGFAPREGNRVWHQAGYSWWVYYQNTDNSLGCVIFNDANPTKCEQPNGYAKSKCSNSTDNSGVTWTCQTTRPIPSLQGFASARRVRLELTSPAPAAFDLGILDSTRTTSDSLDPAALDTATRYLSGAPSDQLDPGQLEFSQSRRLFAKVGSADGAFYVIPTSKGQLCYVITGFSSAGCLASAPLASTGIDWGLSDNDGLGTGEPLVVHGLVANEVVGVDVVAGGKIHQAVLTNNAFYTELEGLPDALIVHRAGNRDTRIPVPRLPG
jgi:hypothetical protein